MRKLPPTIEGDAQPPPPLPADCALYLDFDGTLVELAPRPQDVIVQPHLPGLIERLKAHLGGAVAIITGRWLADVDGMLAPLLLPGAGLHGAEVRRRDTSQLLVHNVPGIGDIVAQLRARFGADPRILIEDKGASVALHYRLAPERAAECNHALRQLVLQRPGLETLIGNKVIEARTRGIHKGNALRQLAQEPAFAGRRPVFVGDDVTDEDAFEVAAELGGFGVKVGAARTVARYRCEGVGAVHDWLAASLPLAPAAGPARAANEGTRHG